MKCNIIFLSIHLFSEKHIVRQWYQNCVTSQNSETLRFEMKYFEIEMRQVLCDRPNNMTKYYWPKWTNIFYPVKGQ